MHRSEIAVILTIAAGFDRRTIGETDVEAWHLAIGHLHFDDTKTAVVAHYQASSDWIMPNHVITGVMKNRRERLALVPELDPPDADPSDPVAYIHQLRAGRRAAADPTTQSRNIREITDRIGGMPG